MNINIYVSLHKLGVNKNIQISNPTLIPNVLDVFSTRWEDHGELTRTNIIKLENLESEKPFRVKERHFTYMDREQNIHIILDK